MKYCIYCGAELTDGAAFCANCGSPVAEAPAGAHDAPRSEPAHAGEPVYEPSSLNTEPQVNHIHIHNEQPSAPVPRPSRGNGLGVAGFVLGIISMVLSWIPIVGFIGLIFSIPGAAFSVAGLIFGICKKRRLGLSITGIILNVLAVIIMFAVLGAMAGADFSYYLS